ncbi:MAG TPA: divergent PAP2 family protein [Candidatus Nitrosotalea sp.]|nr:divergent PAP2 family protein [Candidatus Nitrosotalea sp.]
MRYVLPPLLAWFIAQVMKVIISSSRQRRLNLRVLAETGGMPSSHSAIVAGLTTGIGRIDGVGSAGFAIALIFSIVVMYDAQGVRRAAGRQAALLNQIANELLAGHQIQQVRLRELLGHTPVEVLVGAALGVVIGLLPF